jgi:hypothetical protein
MKCVRGAKPPGYGDGHAAALGVVVERDEERKAVAKRFFFCQQEAVETVIYLYEVQGRRKMPETGDVLRYALKLATGTGKTVVMALFVTWATLHKRKVSGSSLAANFLVRTWAAARPPSPGPRPGTALGFMRSTSRRPCSTTPEARHERRAFGNRVPPGRFSHL